MAEAGLDIENPSPPSLALRVGLLVLLFVSIVGARGWMIENYGDSIPYWDQWHGESQVLLDSEQGDLTLGKLIAPHNEHRILFPRLFWIAIFNMNDGQWDNLPTLYAMTLITASAATLLVAVFLSLTAWRHWRIVVPLVALLYCSPLAWLNMVWGFQAQFHFQILFALITFAGVCLGRPFSVWWWVAVVASIAEEFTSASGFLVAASIVFLVAIQSLRNRSFARASIPNLVWAFAVLLMGVLLLHPTEAHDRLKADSLASFVGAALRNFAWPWHEVAWVGLAMYLPLAILLICYLAKYPFQKVCAVEFVLLLGSFLSAQLLAIAYSRGVDGMAPHDRYFDFHLLGLIANGMALAVLVFEFRGRSQFVVRWTTIAWASMVLAGVLRLGIYDFTSRLPGWKVNAGIQTENVQEYLATGDPQILMSQPRLAVPHGNPKVLLRELEKDRLKNILPACLQSPISIVAESVEGTFALAMLPEGISKPENWETIFSSYAKDGGKGRLLTAPIEADYRYLKFQHAGYQATGGLKLRFVDSEGNVLRRVPYAKKKLKPKDRGWRSVVCEVPHETFRIEAIDARDGGWFAFTEPKKLGRLSAWTIASQGCWQVITLIVLPLLLSLVLVGGHKQLRP